VIYILVARVFINFSGSSFIKPPV